MGLRDEVDMLSGGISIDSETYKINIKSLIKKEATIVNKEDTEDSVPEDTIRLSFEKLLKGSTD